MVKFTFLIEERIKKGEDVVSRDSYSMAVGTGEVELNQGPQVGWMKIDRILPFVKILQYFWKNIEIKLMRSSKR
jgi:hypothetical protein